VLIETGLALDTRRTRPYSSRRLADSASRASRRDMEIRKTETIIEDTLMDGGRRLDQPMRRVAAIAVIRNPLAESTDENLPELVRDGEDLGRVLSEVALKHIDRRRIALLGKAVIVGMDGEPEHGQAILYPKFAQAVRETLETGGAPILGEKRIGRPGSSIDVLLQPIAEGREPASTMEIRIPGSPRADEILVALVVGGPV
jgi:Amino acid synthesis